MTRPHYHFTATAGNINDPHGVTWVDGRYHLFHQYNPLAPEWSPRCHWGHADSADLVRWEHPHVALAPDGVDHGCWSGAVVVADGVATMLYTGVSEGAPHHGRIAAAHGDPTMRQWTRDAGGPLLDGPPTGLDVGHFRDPFVWRHGDGWRLVVGAGLAGGVAAVLQYSSPDLRNWTYEGVLCSRPGSERDPEWTGSVWECPQFFELAGSWVLIVSVWSDDVTEYVAHAVGDYDGATFTPRSWSRYAHGDSPYATTAFVDADGRRCAMSWLRELDRARPYREWAGALTVPHLLTLDGDRLVATPHPDVDSLRTGPVPPAPDGSITVPEQADIVLTTSPGQRVEVHLDGLGLVLDQDRLLIRRPGLGDQVVPTCPDGTVRVLLDADVVEVFAGAGAGAVRIPGRAGASPLTITGQVAALTVHGMERWFPS